MLLNKNLSVLLNEVAENIDKDKTYAYFISKEIKTQFKRMKKDFKKCKKIARQNEDYFSFLEHR